MCNVKFSLKSYRTKLQEREEDETNMVLCPMVISGGNTNELSGFVNRESVYLWERC
jgi:hypothetical protein